MKKQKKSPKHSNFINIQYWMVDRLGLTGNDLIVYAIIYGFSQDGISTFNAGNEYIQKFTGASKMTVIKILKKLTESGLIKKEVTTVDGKHDGITCNRYSVNIDVIDGTGKETIPVTGNKTIPVTGKETIPVRESAYIKEINNKNNNKNGDIFDALSELSKVGVPENVIRDFLKTRRKDFTETAFKYLVNQSMKAGLTVREAVEMVVGNGWSGFQARYVKQNTRPRKQSFDDVQAQRRASITAMIEAQENQEKEWKPQTPDLLLPC